MKISELIKELKLHKKRVGNVEVKIYQIDPDLNVSISNIISVIENPCDLYSSSIVIIK